MAAYSDIIVEHFENPRNLGDITGPDFIVELSDRAFGDSVSLTVRCAGLRIVAVKFQAYGCAPVFALGSVLSEFLRGADQARLDAVEESTIAAMLGGIGPDQQHVTTLGLRLIHAVRAELTRAS